MEIIVCVVAFGLALLVLAGLGREADRKLERGGVYAPSGRPRNDLNSQKVSNHTYSENRVS